MIGVHFATDSARVQWSALFGRLDRAVFSALTGGANDVTLHLSRRPGAVVVLGHGGWESYVCLGRDVALFHRFESSHRNDLSRFGRAWRGLLVAVGLLGIPQLCGLFPAELAAAVGQVQTTDFSAVVDPGCCLLPMNGPPEVVAKQLAASRRQLHSVHEEAPDWWKKEVLSFMPDAAGNSLERAAVNLLGKEATAADIFLLAAATDKPPLPITSSADFAEMGRSFALRGRRRGSAWLLARVRSLYPRLPGGMHVTQANQRYRRRMLPQIPSEQLTDFLNFLEAQHIKWTRLPVSADLIYPAQVEIDPKKVVQLAQKRNLDDAGEVLISEDNILLDGHHRWAAARLTSGILDCVKVQVGIERLVELAHDFLDSQPERLLASAAGPEPLADLWSASFTVPQAARAAFAAQYQQAPVDEERTAEFALQLPVGGAYQPRREEELAEERQDARRVVRVIRRRFRRPFGEVERAAARDTLRCLEDEEAVLVYRQLVRGGHTPQTAQDAADRLYRVLGRSSRFNWKRSPEAVLERASDYHDGQRHVAGMASRATESLQLRRDFQDAWTGLNQTLDAILAISGRNDSAELPVADRPTLAACEAGFRQANRTASGIRQEIAKRARQSRDAFADMLATDRSPDWEVRFEGGAQGVPAILDALRWLKRIVSARPAEEGKMHLTVRLDPACLRGYFMAPDRIVVGVNDASRSVVHLVGHALEAQLPGSRAICASFIRARCQDEWVSDIGFSPGGRPLLGENGRLDTFDSWFRGTDAWYCGKENRSGETEILPMALEAFWEDAACFCASDPEFAVLVVGILKGDLR